MKNIQSKRKKSILFVVHALEPGGAEMFFVRLGEYLQTYFEIHILSMFPEKDDAEFIEMMHDRFDFKLMPRYPSVPGPVLDWLYWKLNAICALLGKKGLRSALIETRNLKHLKDELNDRNISLINSSLYSADNFAVNTLKKLSGIPVILTMHSQYNPEEWPIDKNERQKFFDHAKQVFENVNGILYTADRNTEIFDEFDDYVGPEPVKQYMGYQPPEVSLNIRSTLGIKNTDFVISMVARGAREKGWTEAIASFRKLHASHKNTWLILVCTETEHIAELKKNTSANEHIIFTGYMSNPSDVVYSSDCTILPTFWPESLPYSIIESLGVGRPVLATPVAEIPEMLKSDKGMAGSIIPFTSEGLADTDVLTEELEKLVLIKETTKHLQHLATLAFQKFSMDKCGKHYKEVFQSVAKD